MPMLFLINLDSATERRAHMSAQLEAFPLALSRIGVDFRRKTRDEIDAWVDANLPGIAFDHEDLSGAEIGCWASHLTAWKALAQSRAQACTVLEDDLRLDAAFPDAVAALGRVPGFDIVFLGTSSRNISTRERSSRGSFFVHRPVGPIFNTWGYVISRAWATGFFARRPLYLDRPIDHVTGGSVRKLKPRIGVLRPAVVDEDPGHGATSQIEPFTFRIDRSRLIEKARRRILASRVSAIYYRLYDYL